MNDSLFKLYVPCVNEDDLSVLFEDFYKLLCSMIIKDNVYRIVTVFLRIHNNSHDKDIRHKMKALNNVTPQDVGIDNYLLLNDSSPINTIANE
jgi:hypothetical protein